MRQQMICLAAGLLQQNKIHQLNIKSLANAAKINLNTVSSVFSKGDKQLLLETVEYFGKKWNEEIIDEINRLSNKKEKLKMLASKYALGSIRAPEILSLYIDLWKWAKDDDNDYVRERLKRLYASYVDTFVQLGNTIMERNNRQEEIQSFAYIMTILSDVIHIQSFILQHNIDFGVLNYCIEKIILSFFMEEHDE